VCGFAGHVCLGSTMFCRGVCAWVCRPWLPRLDGFLLDVCVCVCVCVCVFVYVCLVLQASCTDTVQGFTAEVLGPHDKLLCHVVTIVTTVTM